MVLSRAPGGLRVPCLFFSFFFKDKLYHEKSNTCSKVHKSLVLWLINEHSFIHRQPGIKTEHYQCPLPKDG